MIRSGGVKNLGQEDLSWLWDADFDEAVPCGPSSQRPKDAVGYQEDAWNQLARSMGEPVRRDDHVCSVNKEWAMPSLRSQTSNGKSISSKKSRRRGLLPKIILGKGGSSPKRASVELSVNDSLFGGMTRSSMFNSISSRASTAAKKLVRRASRLTLSHVHNPQSVPIATAIWRGHGLETSLEEHSDKAFDMASHRNDCKLQTMAECRQKAVNWRQMQRTRHLKKLQDDWKSELADDPAVDAELMIAIGRSKEGESRNTIVSSKRHSIEKKALGRQDSPAHASDSSDKVAEQPKPKPGGDGTKVKIISDIEQEMVYMSGVESDDEDKASLFSLSRSSSKGLFGGRLGSKASRQRPTDPAADDATQAVASFTTHASIITSHEDVPALPDSMDDPGDRGSQRSSVASLGDDMADASLIPLEAVGQSRASKSIDSRKDWSFVAASTYTEADPKMRRSSGMMKQSRMRRLLDARQREFRERPMQDQDRLRRAFAAADQDATARLDTKGVRKALECLGLEGNGRDERSAVSELLEGAVTVCGHVNFFDFVFQIVPKVEQRVQELRSPKLHEEFVMLDQRHNQNQVLREDVCLTALETHARNCKQLDVETINAFWRQFSMYFSDVFAQFTTARDAVDFAGYQGLVKEMETARSKFFVEAETRASFLCKVSPAQAKAHFGQLAHLFRVFQRHSEEPDNPEEQLAMHLDQTPFALIEAGVVPGHGEPFDRVTTLCDDYEEQQGNTSVRFTEFLSFIHKHREESKRYARALLQAQKKKLNYKPIQSQELPSFIEDMGLVIDCIYTFEELVSLCTLAHDEENDDRPDQEDVFLGVILHVVEHLRVVSRTKENMAGASHGYNTEEIQQLRIVFSQVSRTGATDAETLQSFLASHTEKKDGTGRAEKYLEKIIRQVAAYSTGTTDHEALDDDDEGFGHFPRPGGRRSRASMSRLSMSRIGIANRGSMVQTPSRGKRDTVLKVPMPLVQASLKVEKCDRFQSSKMNKKDQNIKFDSFLKICSMILR
eukprot:TRINITY_DN23493_c0_g2_i2.p1 TRINITY_DN23493_c0_g2~~TRINITY_DN23493_c0_g2_i2.p1  ORF type:complete len:1012 (-),score=260.57 TRINITY_DN23493_c0_g2_i2:160-3195(-)